jgi:hypothetical protein
MTEVRTHANGRGGIVRPGTGGSPYGQNKMPGSGRGQPSRRELTSCDREVSPPKT